MTTEELYAVDLQSLGACGEARDYVSQHASLREAIAACTRADWLAWLLRRVGHPLAPRLESECVRRARAHAAAYAADAADAAAYAAYADAAHAATYAATYAAVYAANAVYAARTADNAAAAEHRYLCDWARARLAGGER